jgi:hypothetical protein
MTHGRQAIFGRRISKANQTAARECARTIARLETAAGCGSSDHPVKPLSEPVAAGEAHNVGTKRLVGGIQRIRREAVAHAHRLSLVSTGRRRRVRVDAGGDAVHREGMGLVSKTQHRKLMAHPVLSIDYRSTSAWRSCSSAPIWLVVERISYHVAVMYLGRILEIGPRAATFEDPRHPCTKSLLGAVPIADPSRRRPYDDSSSRPVPSPIFPVR